jgi:hypothetical protein
MPYPVMIMLVLINENRRTRGMNGSMVKYHSSSEIVVCSSEVKVESSFAPLGGGIRAFA